LGVVRHKQREFVVADIPGLIEGAADGAGIGDRFLGHIERCRVLLHLVDANDTDVAESYRIVREELEAYGAGLAEKPVVIGLNKIDMLDDELIEVMSKELADASGADVIPLSGASGVGVDWVLDQLLEAVGPAADSPVSDDGEEDAVEWSPI
jgi:GTP-binding protein